MTAPHAFARAVVILLIICGALGSAFVLERFGYAPCDLCLEERVPYYGGLALALLAVLLAAKGPASLLPMTFTAIALTFAVSALLGAYHSGIEWGFWAGPIDCSGPIHSGISMKDFLDQLTHVKVVRCDAPAIRIFGVSLAMVNAMLSLALAGFAFWSVRHQGEA